MNGGTIAFVMAGLICFGSGAYVQATGEGAIGIGLMAVGLAFQVLALARLRSERTKTQTPGDARDEQS